MSVIFSNLFGMDIRTYGLILFSGMVVYQVFAGIVSQSSLSLLNNEAMIKQTPIKLNLFPLSAAIASFVEGVLLLASLLIFMLILGQPLYFSGVWVPIILLFLFLFSFGIGVAASVVVVKIRDLGQAIPLGLQILLFLSPVFYKGSDLGGKLAYIIAMNPLSWFIEAFRGALLYGDQPSIKQMTIIVTMSLVSMLLGSLLFKTQACEIPMRL